MNNIDYDLLRRIIREELDMESSKRIRELEECLRFMLEVGMNASKIRHALRIEERQKNETYRAQAQNSPAKNQ